MKKAHFETLISTKGFLKWAGLHCIKSHLLRKVTLISPIQTKHLFTNLQVTHLKLYRYTSFMKPNQSYRMLKNIYSLLWTKLTIFINYRFICTHTNMKHACIYSVFLWLIFCLFLSFLVLYLSSFIDKAYIYTQDHKEVICQVLVKVPRYFETRQNSACTSV